MRRNRRLANQDAQTDFSSSDSEENFMANQNPLNILQAQLAPPAMNYEQQIANLTDQVQQLQQQHQQMLALHPQNAPAGAQAVLPAPAAHTKAPYTGRPPLFDIDTDKGLFKIWLEKWKFFNVSSGLNLITDPIQLVAAKRAALSAAFSNSSVRWIQANTNLSEEQKQNADEILTELEKFIKSAVNPVVNALKMLQRKQRSGESIEGFTTDLQDMLGPCELDDVTDTSEWFLKICLISNIDNHEIRTRLLREPLLTYNEAKSLCISLENANKHSQQVREPEISEVNKISKYKNVKKFAEQNEATNRGRSQSRDPRRYDSQSRNRNFPQSNEKSCQRCGFPLHAQSKNCPALNQSCKSCNKIGHFAKMCRNKNNSGNACAMKANLFSLCLNSTQVHELENVFVTLNSGHFDFNVSALPDSGSNLNAIGVTDLEFLGENIHNLLDAKFYPLAADGHKIETVGLINDAKVTLNDQTITESFYVLNGLQKPILSRETLKKLKLIPKKFPFVTICQMEEKQNVEIKNNQKTDLTLPDSGFGPEFEALRSKYKNVFDGQCKIMNGEKAHISIDPKATPISVGAHRSIAEPLLPALKKEIDLLVSQKIIEKIEYATDWLHPIVVVPKKTPGEVRLVVDPSKLNQHIKKPISTQAPPWEKVRKIPSGMRYLAVFDSLKGYFQIELDEQSKDLTAFLTPFGRYRYNRLPMGYCISSDIFDSHYGKIVDNLSNCERVCEDFLIYARTKKEFLEKCEEYFKVCDENNITLNLNKVQWMKQEVLFAGYIIGQNGYRIDPKLSEALKNFPKPENITDMRSFFGLANQTCNFSDEIAEALNPLKPLLKKQNTFLWLPEHEQAFEKARLILSSPKALAYYHPSRPTRLQVDASRLKGLGFILKQQNENMEWKTIQAGSRFLSEAETRYAMIELELLAIVWACQKCRMFVEGLPKEQFTILTDHQPLIPIVSKYTLPQISNKRLQRLRMKIDDLQFRIEWISGKLNVEADALSRAPHANATEEDEVDENLFSQEKTAKTVLHSMEINSNEANFLDARLKEILDASLNDIEYSELSRTIEVGFPNAKTALTSTMKPFWYARESLHFDEDGFIVYEDRLFIPKNLRSTILKRLLAMHQSTDKMVARAKQCIWWPHLNIDIKNISLTCKPCQEYKPSNPSEKYINHEIPSFPFQFVHTDFCQYENRHYLVVVDQFSGYPFVMQFPKEPDSEMLIETLMIIFAQFSVPVKIFSDGGPQYLSEKFKNYCFRWGIQHITSSPHFPRSNGVAENAVKQMKKIIRGTFVHSQNRVNNEDFSAGIMLFRNTPCYPLQISPAEILFGRQIRDTLPISRRLLKPMLRYDVEKQRREALVKQSKYSPKIELPLLPPGSRVFVQNPATKRWTSEGSIISFGHNEREYLVRMDSNNRILRRNRHFLWPQSAPANSPPSQPVQPPSSTTKDPENPTTPPAKRTYAEVAREVNGEVRIIPNVRPKRQTRKPVRFSDKNFVYK